MYLCTSISNIKLLFCFMSKKLIRSSDRILTGVCGGIAEFVRVDATLIRIGLSVSFMFLDGLKVAMLYMILTFVIPNKY